MTEDIISKLKASGLTGRGGAAFPTATKWELVKNTKADKKYIIVNGSEGEPGVKKDFFILRNYPGEVINGVKIAIKYLNASKAYFYLNPKYYKKFEKTLRKLIGTAPIKLFKKPKISGYVGGVETTAVNVLEGKRAEPKLRPPFPTTNGLFNSPTLINNIETFYAISLIASEKYSNKRFYTINGKYWHKGVYELPEKLTVEQILKQTKNYSGFDFFVQVGGDASGEVLNSKQLSKPAKGAASITIYSLQKHNPKKLIKHWISFFDKESCGKCTSCREGTYRLNQIINSKNPDWKIFAEILNTLNETSFCGLGGAVPIPLKTYLRNVFPLLPEEKKNVLKNHSLLLKEIAKLK